MPKKTNETRKTETKFDLTTCSLTEKYLLPLFQ